MEEGLEIDWSKVQEHEDKGEDMQIDQGKMADREEMEKEHR